MNIQLILDYLSALSINNSREWYHANKDDYKKANAEFEELLQALIMTAAFCITIRKTLRLRL